MEEKYPSQSLAKFVLRLPDGMRDRIKEIAAQNGRSMNAEIIATLEEKYPPISYNISWHVIPDADDIEKVKASLLPSRWERQTEEEFLNGLKENEPPENSIVILDIKEEQGVISLLMAMR